ncbi:MAG: FecR domain-containing protein [bacterium]
MPDVPSDSSEDSLEGPGLSPRDRLIDRALSGSATPDDVAQLSDDAAGREMADALGRAFQPPREHANADAAWASVNAAIAQRLERNDAVPSTVLVHRRRPRVAWTAAAALAAGLLVALGAWQYAARGKANNIGEQLIASSGTQPRTVTLADGTNVVLGPGSTLRLGVGYGVAARDVTLDGSGYFTVVHQASRPFRVHIKGGVIEDIGTRFVVAAYPELARAEIAVADGRVSLAGSQQGGTAVVLERGDVGELTGAGAAMTAHGVDVEARLGWMRGELEFDNALLSDALPVLSRWYDADVRLGEPSLGGRRLSARFLAAQKGDAVFDGVAMALGLKAVRTGRIVTLVRGTQP